ncbi:uncharacterized protein LOC133363180 isoform X1 [Rhineura floridana]|uniref:uncharacterized protein LOC133363180 isoform X1 n=1 Tax=Rhineura floridana TaxID=261503 RepID=UPI002AC81F3F|nr:uncharacterized protein LOC133363180 isoform X1 [Rhineura floridana]
MLTFTFLSVFLPHAPVPALILPGPQQAARQEEVNLLVYGVLQFSGTLRDLYDSTAQKLDRIRHRTDLYEHGLGVLLQQTQSAQQKQKEIREIIERLKAEDMISRQQGQSNKEALQKVLLGQHNLAQQVGMLEEMLVIMEDRGSQTKGWEFSALKESRSIPLIILVAIFLNFSQLYNILFEPQHSGSTSSSSCPLQAQGLAPGTHATAESHRLVPAESYPAAAAADGSTDRTAALDPKPDEEPQRCHAGRGGPGQRHRSNVKVKKAKGIIISRAEKPPVHSSFMTPFRICLVTWLILLQQPWAAQSEVRSRLEGPSGLTMSTLRHLLDLSM